MEDFYGSSENPETLFLAPNCGLKIKLDRTEYGEEFGYEYEVLNINQFPLVKNLPNKNVKGWLSPTRPVTLPTEAKREAGIPVEAKQFAYLYPPRGLAEYIDWDKVSPTKDQLSRMSISVGKGSFRVGDSSEWALPYVASFGGYAYFDEHFNLLCVNAISFKETPYKLTFEGPFVATKNSFREISGLNRYQSLYLDIFREVGYIGSAWIDPEDYTFIDTEVEGQSDIKNLHGGFLYFRHDKTAVIFLVEFAFNLTTPSLGVGSLIIDAFRLCKHELRTKSNLSVTCPSIEQIEDMQLHNAAREGSKEHINHYVNQCGGTLFIEKTLFLTQDSFGWLPLHHACCYHAQDYELIEKIVQSCPQAVQKQNKNNLAPIHLACHHNASIKVIEILLENDPNKKTLKMKSKHLGFLPLHFACSNSKTSIEVIRTLILEDNEAVSVEGRTGCTPLHTAIAENHDHKVIQLLLRYGSGSSTLSTRKTNPILLEKVNGMLPIHLACLKGCSVDIVSLLLEADVEDKCFYEIVEECTEYDLVNSTILHIALAHSPIDVIKLLLMKEVRARCVSGGFRENLLTTEQHSRGGMYPIHVACRRKDVGIDIIQTLLRLERASIFYTDNLGNTPLHYVCNNKDVDEKLVQLLLDAEDEHVGYEGNSFKFQRPAVKTLNKNDETPLHVAVNSQATGAHALLRPEHICLRQLGGEGKDKLVKLVLADRNVQKNVVKTLAQRRYFTFIMLELYANIAATVIYFNASQRLILRDSPIEVYESVALIMCTTFFTLRELIQLSSSSFANYISDGWNWIEFSSIAVLLTATIHMIRLRESIDLTPHRTLFIISGILLLLQFIFIVRTTFLPFARFVAGLLAITFSLIPFLIVSMMLLLTFTYSYLVSGERAEECPDFGGCLLWTLEGFFYGMDGFAVTPTLDLFFGLVAVVVL